MNNDLFVWAFTMLIVFCLGILFYQSGLESGFFRFNDKFTPDPWVQARMCHDIGCYEINSYDEGYLACSQDIISGLGLRTNIEATPRALPK